MSREVTGNQIIKPRDPNTDLIRAIAISLVLIHHIGQYLTLVPDIGHSFLRLGAYGVDLFFVLSGWLIGRLYWNEKKKFGNVDIFRFWLRRWFRTIPPYLTVLPVAFCAVYLSRGDLFDWRYLFFLQNYETQMPFFLASWSLCVEEHFYLLLPLAIAVMFRFQCSPHVALPVLAGISLVARIADANALTDQPFGYAFTATHLRLEGLCIGVWFSYLSVNRLETWDALKKLSRLAVIPLMLGFLTIPFWSEWCIYHLGFSYVAVMWAAVLGTLVAVSPLRIAKWRPTYLLALWSYSIYLTHNLVIHACDALSDKFGIYREASSPLCLILILLTGWMLYQLVENPVMRLRDGSIPRRQNP